METKTMSQEETNEIYLNDKDNENLYNLHETIDQVPDIPDTIHGELSFSSIPIIPKVLKGIYQMGYNSPSKIQECVLPIMLSEPYVNVIAQSQSGTGKTAAFTICMLNRVKPELKYPQIFLRKDITLTRNLVIPFCIQKPTAPPIQGQFSELCVVYNCLCIAPTYELAFQIGSVIEQMSKYVDIKVKYALRGEPCGIEGQLLEEQIVVGTPGKVLDFCTKSKVIDLSKLIVFVLDEADVMISMQGHQVTSIRLKKLLSPECQTLLFSATYSEAIAEFAKSIVDNPKVFRLRNEQLSLSSIGQYYFNCDGEEDKLNILMSIYATITIGQSIIFCYTRKCAVWLTKMITKRGIPCDMLSGELDIKDRIKVITDFRKSRVRALVTTNLSARGLDIEQVTMVVNFDMPTIHGTDDADTDTYIHRIGRTGRFGKIGIAVNLIASDRDLDILHQIEKYFKVKIAMLSPDTEDIQRIEPNVKGDGMISFDHRWSDETVTV